MASTKGEPRRDGHRGRGSEMSVGVDTFEIAPNPLAVHKIVNRLGLSAPTASVVAELAFTVADRWGRA